MARIPLGPIAFVLAVAFASCTPDGVPDDAVTYHDDVAPILRANCVACHRDGAIAPFQLTTYDEVSSIGERLKVVTEERIMPPNNVDASGACGEYQDARWLSDDDIATIGAWVEGGMLEGDAPADAPDDFVDLSEPLAESALNFTMPETYTPQSTAEHPDDDYRCFPLAAEPAEVDRYMTGYEVRPGEPEIFHHMLLFALTSEEARTTASALDGEDARAGWECFGDGGVDDAKLLAVWAPGKATTHYPAGTGIKIPAGATLVMQVHYNIAAGQLPDLSTIRIQMADSVDKEALLSGVIHDEFELAPGEESVSTTASFPLLGLPRLEVYGIFPHMHLLGRKLRVEAYETLNDQAAPRCLVDVQRWDFAWQDLNFYREPLILTPEESLSITCEFDTRGRTEPVTFGEGTADEMCLVFTYVTLEDGGSFDDLL